MLLKETGIDLWQRALYTDEQYVDMGRREASM